MKHTIPLAAVILALSTSSIQAEDIEQDKRARKTCAEVLNYKTADEIEGCRTGIVEAAPVVLTKVYYGGVKRISSCRYECRVGESKSKWTVTKIDACDNACTKVVIQMIRPWL